MKRTLLVTFLVSCLMAAFGQYRNLPVNAGTTKGKAILSTAPDGTVSSENTPNIPAAITGFRVQEKEIGRTNFDIQTIASLGRRIGEPSDGTIGAAWQMSFIQPNFDDRGTGYNYFDGADWGPNPTAQVEGTRSGYPSYTVMENGTEVVISHKALSAGWQLIAYTKPLGATTWTPHILPSDVPGGNVWAKIAAGGADGNSLHVVGITLHPDFGGSEYLGMTNHPLYWRSTDGGQTWDKQDVVLPGVDSSKYLTMPAEAYNIEARGETVAISITGLFGDILVMKSTDNGETWEKHVVYDFPLDKWNGEAYSESDLPPDDNAPEPLATFSSDGAGSLVIDDQGMVHLFFGELYVAGNTADASISVYLGTNGIGYWSESSGTLTTIAGAEDLDGDMEITLGGSIGDYRYTNAGLASFPTASIDADGNIFLVYMAFNELFTDGSGGNTYRHIFIIKSADGGETWSAPFGIINPEVTELPEFVEAAFPAIPSFTGDNIQLIYQQDYIPGLTASGATVPDQYIMHLSLNKDDFSIISEDKEVISERNSLTIFPNPAHTLVYVDFDLAQGSVVSLSLFSLLGEQLSSKKLDNLGAGKQSTFLDVSDLNPGIYVVKVENDEMALTKKLVID
ncbi:MAG: T9SS type A sorting domain-containing protein [Bacteroidetes bacterium]|nr:T9SS type A sorting domain-containing protein [Bacteroidota bacterium]